MQKVTCLLFFLVISISSQSSPPPLALELTPTTGEVEQLENTENENFDNEAESTENDLKGQIHSLTTLVKEMEQKIAALETANCKPDIDSLTARMDDRVSRTDSKLRTMKLRLTILEQAGVWMEDELENFENKLSDRVESLQNILEVQANLTLKIFADYCRRTLKDKIEMNDVVGFGELYNFCVTRTNFTLTGVPAKFLLGDVVSKLKVRLYTGANLTGNFVDFNFEGQEDQGCLDFYEMNGMVQSIDTLDTCARLCTHNESMAIYPKMWENGEDMTKVDLIDGIRYLCPCFENELDDTLIDLQGSDGQKFYRKLGGRRHDTPLVPDLVSYGLGGNHSNTDSFPITTFITGFGQRVELILAKISHHHILRGQAEGLILRNEDDTYFSQLDKQKGDTMGHFLGVRLGPQDGLPFSNIFAQSHRHREMQGRLEDDIVDWLSLDQNLEKSVWLYMNVDYEGENGTRPNGMSCWVIFGEEFTRTRYLSNQ